jgi:CelD/BcsL family acetyltransferase involved in cellulose biosynthesis
MSLADIDIFAHTQPRARYRVSIGNDWSAANWPWRAGLSTPFQRGEWLGAFYQSLVLHEPDMLPLIAHVTDGDGIPAFHLPLICRSVGALQVVEFADLNMTDFNAPLLGPAAPRNPADALEAWKAVKRALPSCDEVGHVEIATQPTRWKPGRPSSARCRPAMRCASPRCRR